MGYSIITISSKVITVDAPFPELIPLDGGVNRPVPFSWISIPVRRVDILGLFAGFHFYCNQGMVGTGICHSTRYKLRIGSKESFGRIGNTVSQNIVTCRLQVFEPIRTLTSNGVLPVIDTRKRVHSHNT